jgi:hypothetical protein
VGVFADVRAEAGTGEFAHVLDGVDSEPVDVRLADPIAISLYEYIYERRAGGIVVIGIILERDDVAMLVLGIGIVAVRAVDLAAPMVERRVPQLDR